MVGELAGGPRRTRIGEVRTSLQDDGVSRMEGSPLARQQRPLDRLAEQLVPEAELPGDRIDDERATVERLPQRRPKVGFRPCQDLRDERFVDRSAGDGDRCQDLASLPGQPAHASEQDLDNGRWLVLRLAPQERGAQFLDEQRVALGSTPDPLGRCGVRRPTRQPVELADDGGPIQAFEIDPGAVW